LRDERPLVDAAPVRPELRSGLAIGASAVAAIAAVVANVTGNGDIVPFFVLLTFAGGVLAWAGHEPFEGGRRVLARLLASLWAFAGLWVAGLLVWFVAYQGSASSPVAEPTVLGLRATVYHLCGLYGSLVLAVAAAFGRERWFDRHDPAAEPPTRRRSRPS
jgi:hypothetical protein